MLGSSNINEWVDFDLWNKWNTQVDDIAWSCKLQHIAYIAIKPRSIIQCAKIALRLWSIFFQGGSDFHETLL